MDKQNNELSIILNLFRKMKEATIRALENINNCPNYIDDLYHCTDLYRVYDAIMEIYQNNESIEDAKQFLDKNLKKDFIKRQLVLDDCKDIMDAIFPFLEYIKYDRR